MTAFLLDPVENSERLDFFVIYNVLGTFYQKMIFNVQQNPEKLRVLIYGLGLRFTRSPPHGMVAIWGPLISSIFIGFIGIL